MVRDYRAWLQSELQLRPSGTGDLYAEGQRDMAKRAIDRLDAEVDDRVVVELTPETCQAVTEALDMMAEAETLPDALVELLRVIRTAQQ